MYDHDVTSIRASSFVEDKPVKFIVHGYLDSGEKRWIKVIYPMFSHRLSVQMS